VDLFRLRDEVSALFLKVPGGDLGRRLGRFVERVPVTRPGWFLLEPADEGEPTVVAYEDRRGLWWEYMPRTGRLHNIPWLSTGFHYGDGSGYLRKPLIGREVKRLIAEGVGRASDDLVSIAHDNDLASRDPRTVLR
jgi:hypothetical protein